MEGDFFVSTDEQTVLGKFRNMKGISQMKPAELCGASLNYIGEIEIGRRFPSLPLIGKMSRELEIEPFRFFMTQRDAWPMTWMNSSIF
jgi:transcriptional regulator with XRE-family HTH domain